MERTLGLIKPDMVAKDMICSLLVLLSEKFKIADVMMHRLSVDEAKDFLKEYEDKPEYQEMVEFMSMGKMMAIVIEGENVIETLYKRVKEEIIPEYASNEIIDAAYASEDKAHAEEDIKFFFGKYV